jgi:hypothetical protein
MALRLLIAAGGTVSSAEELPFGVRALVEAADEVLIVTPAFARTVRMADVCHGRSP